MDMDSRHLPLGFSLTVYKMGLEMCPFLPPISGRELSHQELEPGAPGLLSDPCLRHSIHAVHSGNGRRRKLREAGVLLLTQTRMGRKARAGPSPAGPRPQSSWFLPICSEVCARCLDGLCRELEGVTHVTPSLVFLFVFW